MELIKSLLNSFTAALIGFLNGLVYNAYVAKKRELKLVNEYEEAKDNIDDKFDDLESELRKLSKVSEAEKARDSKVGSN